LGGSFWQKKAGQNHGACGFERGESFGGNVSAVRKMSSAHGACYTKWRLMLVEDMVKAY
jgi:hypothetical protein